MRAYHGSKTATESVVEMEDYLNTPVETCEVLAKHFETSDHISYTVCRQSAEFFNVKLEGTQLIASI